MRGIPAIRLLAILVFMLYSECFFAQEKRFEPNDYGLTAKITPNKGLHVSLDYLDFLGLPKAWYYTTGRRDIAIGIADGTIDTTIADFKGKTRIFRKSAFVNAHGMSVAATAAAQGDNAFGIPGLCYDCSIYGTMFGSFGTFDQLLELSEAGARVINCSWVGNKYFPEAQKAVNTMFENGTIIVAGAGNESWAETKGNLIYYPASYDKVISVSSGMYKYENPKDAILYQENGNPYVENVRGMVGRTGGFVDNDPNKPIHTFHVSTATLNEHVDILAPTVGAFRYGLFAWKNEQEMMTYQGTSMAAPFVTGTIGLMFSLYPCLPMDEVESILKITAMNIDYIEANKPYKGMYGAGMLQTGDAVELVYQLYSEHETAFIDNQDFNRWNFKLTALSKEVVIQNQRFTESASLDLKAKQKIVLKPGTILKPTTGKIQLSIDPTLKRECDFQFRDASLFPND